MIPFLSDLFIFYETSICGFDPNEELLSLWDFFRIAYAGYER
jgi:hypothetical protein